MNDPYQYIVLHESCLDHPGIIAVHAAHAAGESCFDGPASGDTRVVALVAKDSEDLRALASELEAAGIRYALMIETDGLRSGQATALGIAPTTDRERVRPYFKRFRMLR